MTKGLNKYWALTYMLGSKDLESLLYCVGKSRSKHV